MSPSLRDVTRRDSALLLSRQTSQTFNWYGTDHCEEKNNNKNQLYNLKMSHIALVTLFSLFTLLLIFLKGANSSWGNCSLVAGMTRGLYVILAIWIIELFYNINCTRTDSNVVFLPGFRSFFFFWCEVIGFCIYYIYANYLYNHIFTYIDIYRHI